MDLTHMPAIVPQKRGKFFSHVIIKYNLTNFLMESLILGLKARKLLEQHKAFSKIGQQWNIQ